MTTALERLTTGYYNALAYDAVTNPGGFGRGGHRVNLTPWTADMASVAQATNAAVLNAAQVTADKAIVLQAKTDTLAAAGPVIAGMAAYGFPARVQITNLDTLALSGHFFATGAATGRPAGENSGGYVVATSDGTANNGSQLFHSIANGKLYKRFRNGGPGSAWGSWEELTTAAAGNDTAFGAESTIASAATTNIGAAGSRMVEITGTTTITSLGATAVTTNPHYMVRFAGALTLTHHATDLILPDGKNILTAAGDYALFQCTAAGKWRCLAYFRAKGGPLFNTAFGPKVDIASAATTDLGSISPSLNAQITGTTTITSLGASATTDRPIYRVRFSGVLTLTHNAASLILPGGANITTASGDTAVFEYLGGGNWKCLAYAPVSGKLLPAGFASTAQAKAGTSTDLAVNPAGLAAAVQSNSMGYAADSSADANTITANLTPAIGAYVEGMAVDIKVQATNTGAVTMNLNGLGAVSVKFRGADVEPGDLVDGQIYRFYYDGSFFQLAAVRDRTVRRTTYVVLSGGSLFSGFSTELFTVGRSDVGRYSIALTAPAASPSDWGARIFAGNAGGSLNVGANEKTKNSSTMTFQTRNGGNNYEEASSLDIEVWINR